jgi:hypothetical protein
MVRTVRMVFTLLMRVVAAHNLADFSALHNKNPAAQQNAIPPART